MNSVPAMDTAMAPQSTSIPPPAPATADEDVLAGMYSLVQTALDYKLKGNPVTYNVLLSKMERTSDDEERRQLYLVLPRCISTLTKDMDAYHELVHRIYTFDFLTTMPVIEAYIRLITHLVTAHTSFLQPTIHMLVRNLQRVPRPAPVSVSPLAVQIKSTLSRRVSIPAIHAGPSEADLNAEFEVVLQQRFAAVHVAFEKVLQLVPASIHHVFHCLCDYYPHKRLETPIQLSYLNNLFQLTTYAKGLQERVLGLVVEKLVAIDVEIKLDTAEEDVFTMDDFLDDDTCVDPENMKGVDEMADKLDHLMLATFTYLEAHDHPRLFSFLLKSFDQSILNTHRSKYPQFLLFYVCKQPTEHQELLLSQLISVALDAKVPPVTRLSCSSYLASYVARAKYLSMNAVKHTLFHVMRYIHGQIDVLEETTATTPIAVFSVPPTVDKCVVDLIQSACYIVCFRGLELCGTEAGYTFVRSLGWTRVLTSAIHPMRHAAFHAAVASEFMNVAELLGLVSDDAIESLWEGMKQTSAKTLERSHPNGASSTSMCFFPFDPYLLRRSFRFIGPLYLYWKHADPTFSGNSEAFALAQTHMKAYEAQENGDSESGDDDDEDDNVSMTSGSYVSVGGGSFVRSSMSEMSVVGSFTGSEDFDFGGRHAHQHAAPGSHLVECGEEVSVRVFKSTSLHYHDEEEFGF
ncbi:hypothetical protein H310_01652 [Aphanomyces invadans]|uniref:RNA polymerase I-specific transcription initiation factor RRN3 n=1 Tax=Aphanomyces invadans TaxID=157072 RepID=A0A024UUA9_9STRA|nr:hypothetical protein H310_01652 [Aphanomyces invadans]ETW09253.1 hypothetical protein H310_01652 [Aphanomyces invadans]|eukprot:XP_008863058.1 hypothetical protein H310_01652 [Aphanomyces invadans]